MINLSTYTDGLHPRAVAVYGLAKSGLAAVKALRAADVTVYVYDDQPEQMAAAIASGCLALDPDFHRLQECACLILTPGVPLNFPAPHPVVLAARQYGVEVIGDIELFARAKTKHKTIGVTGTNGKSTTTALIAHILNANGIPATPCGNIGKPILEVDGRDDTILVIELSSYQLDLCPHFTPNIAVHLNLTPDHLDRHGTMENYARIKEQIFRGPGVGLCGIDDPYSVDMFERKRRLGVRTMIPVSCTHAVNNGLHLSNNDIADTHYEGGIVGCIGDLPTLRGRHNQQNVLMAYGVARAMGLSIDQIFSALATYPGLPHRQLNVRTINGISYINDSKATNADAAEKALLTYNNIYWIVGGLPKARGLAGLEPYARRIRHAYLIGTAAEDFAQFMSANGISSTYAETIETAVDSAHTRAMDDVRAGLPPGVVLLSPACASFDQFQSYEHRGDVFTALVRNLPEAV